MFWLILGGLVLGAALVLFLAPSNNISSAGPMTEITAPDNSTGKVIPRLYGKARLNGNNIYYGGLTSTAIVVEG